MTSVQRRVRPRLWVRVVGLAVAGVIALFTFYGVNLVGRAFDRTRLLAEGVSRFSGDGLVADLTLGHAPAPRARWTHEYPRGHSVVFRHDEHGLRIGRRKVADAHGLIVTLGCSYTYGDGVAAEESYAFQLAELVSAEVVNGACSAYGLAQMVLRARELVSGYQPDVLIVQYSPWLVLRAMTEFAPSVGGLRPAPYVVSGADGDELAIAPPVWPFHRPSLHRDILALRADEGGRVSVLKPFVAVTLRDDLSLAGLHLRRLLTGEPPRPHANAEQVERWAYSEIARVAADHDVKVIVLSIGDDVDSAWLAEAGLDVVDGTAALYRAYPGGDRVGAVHAFKQWRGGTEGFDGHPNPLAHRIFAEALAPVVRAHLPSRRAGAGEFSSPGSESRR